MGASTDPRARCEALYAECIAGAISIPQRTECRADGFAGCTATIVTLETCIGGGRDAVDYYAMIDCGLAGADAGTWRSSSPPPIGDGCFALLMQCPTIDAFTGAR